MIAIIGLLIGVCGFFVALGEYVEGIVLAAIPFGLVSIMGFGVFFFSIKS